MQVPCQTVATYCILAVSGLCYTTFVSMSFLPQTLTAQIHWGFDRRPALTNTGTVTCKCTLPDALNT
jgi:hypothetical protein